MADDPFEDILNLEDGFYEEGYQQGMADGAQAGKIEGRSFGLEKGFEKFLDSGRLYGKAIVWANRLPEKQAAQSSTSTPKIPEANAPLSALPTNSRLEKSVTALYALVESESLSTENTDEAVNDFDDRIKKAHGKLRVIENLVGEKAVQDVPSTESGKTEGTEEAKAPMPPAAAAKSGW